MPEVLLSKKLVKFSGDSFADTEEARMETFEYIDGYYNPARRHLGIGYKSPLAFEADYRQRTTNRAVRRPLTPKSVDNKSIKGVKPKQLSRPTF